MGDHCSDRATVERFLCIFLWFVFPLSQRLVWKSVTKDW